MSSDTIRPLLPTSSADFALPMTTSPSNERNSPVHRTRRPSILTPRAGLFPESRHSPLATSSFPPLAPCCTEPSSTSLSGPGCEKKRSSSAPYDAKHNASLGLPTPPHTARPSPTPSTSSLPPFRDSTRRYSIPLKQPRISNLQAESRPTEVEVESEAAFQRLVADLPTTPRSVSDRGRYPEEAGHEEPEREDSPSDDDDDDEPDGYISPFISNPSRHSQPLGIRRPYTPAHSDSGDYFACRPPSSERETVGGVPMDIDMPSGFTSLSTSAPSEYSWRYTPPPTSSGIRSGKRKLSSIDHDRYEPYATSAKRRAVSPSSLSQLRDSGHVGVLGLPISRPPVRPPIAIPVLSRPRSRGSSVTSSPIIGHRHTLSLPRSGNSSPILRAMPLGSPLMRPLLRLRRPGDDREMEGAGEAVSGLSLRED